MPFFVHGQVTLHGVLPDISAPASTYYMHMYAICKIYIIENTYVLNYNLEGESHIFLRHGCTLS